MHSHLLLIVILDSVMITATTLILVSMYRTFSTYTVLVHVVHEVTNGSIVVYICKIIEISRLVNFVFIFAALL